MDAPTVTLRAMTTDEFDRFWDRQADEYVESLAASLPPEAARAKAQDDRRRLLPEGRATPGHRLLTAEDPEGRVVGQVWIGPPEPRVADLLWLYEIRVDERVRRRGYGRALLTAAERTARADGATTLGLNVFGRNRAAIALYESAGYAVTAQQMARPLDGTEPANGRPPSPDTERP